MLNGVFTLWKVTLSKGLRLRRAIHTTGPDALLLCCLRDFHRKDATTGGLK